MVPPDDPERTSTHGCRQRVDATPMIDRDAAQQARIGTSMAVTAMVSVQLGAAASVTAAAHSSVEGVAWLRLAFAAALLLAAVRPWRAPLTRASLVLCLELGVTTAAMNMLFIAAIVRLPLGTASALEFLGPLAVALTRQANGWPGRISALVAAAGVVILTHPWQGGADPLGVACALGAAVAWAAYIVLTQRAGDVLSGLLALALSLPVAALVATITAGPFVVGHLPPHVLLVGLGLALLMPLIPFSLELLALRRLTTGAFGTLMSLEPAIALATGVLLLGQALQPSAILGVFLVVAAGARVSRAGRRSTAVQQEHTRLQPAGP
jgi:inner membrane transporter RhtA